MHNSSPYLFTSQRLGFRNWNESDLPLMAAINADERVMRYFPAQQTTEQTAAFIARQQAQYRRRGFCYFAVDRVEDGQFIGFIGLSEQHYEADFTPCVDIGWRLHTAYWGNGYATEGAKACLEYGFEWCGLETIYAVCPVVNRASEQVMVRAGMTKLREFLHPLLVQHQYLQNCVLYMAQKGMLK